MASYILRSFHCPPFLDRLSEHCCSWLRRSAAVGNRSPAGPVASSPTQAKVTVYGAAGQVSGSLSLLDTGTARCLIDCGAFYANAEDAVPSAGDAGFAFRPQDINAVFVTHCAPRPHWQVAFAGIPRLPWSHLPDRSIPRTGGRHA